MIKYNLLNTSTRENYKKIIEICKDIYLKKSKDYGSAWRILRAPSLTDQIFIKAQRIRSIQEKNEMKIKENIDGEFIGIINYCIMAIIQLEYDRDNIDVEIDELDSIISQGYSKSHIELEDSVPPAKIEETWSRIQDKVDQIVPPQGSTIILNRTAGPPIT